MMFRSLEEDAEYILGVVKLSLDELRTTVKTQTIAAKKIVVYCYLRLDCKYSWTEIGNYCHKDHTTILKSVNKHRNMYNTKFKYYLKKQKLFSYIAL